MGITQYLCVRSWSFALHKEPSQAYANTLFLFPLSFSENYLYNNDYHYRHHQCHVQNKRLTNAHIIFRPNMCNTLNLTASPYFICCFFFCTLAFSSLAGRNGEMLNVHCIHRIRIMSMSTARCITSTIDLNMKTYTHSSDPKTTK